MSLQPGTRLGPYDVVAQIGAGGMGEVYRARDSKLNRDVALKILPEELAVDPDRLARFRREAQVLASLNHPNIAQIYGFEDSANTHVLVLELVEGPTLGDRITHGPIALEEALPIAKQLADALESAHQQGIIHRDLKPANIKVRADGTVKVLDFGLAKLSDPVGSDTVALAQSPTITSPAQMTRLGTILGTAAYMSPEQAKGHPVDKRADIWAFGCVLYEMLTGTRAFQGDDASSVLAAVIRADPNWNRVPARYVRLLKNCLEKDVRQRLRDIGDAWGLVPDEDSTAQHTAHPVSIAALTLAALSLAALAGVAWVHFGEPSPAPPAVVRFEIVPPEKTAIQKFAVSPDGRKVAFYALGDTGDGSIWVRDFDSLESKRLIDTMASPSLSWSPDGRFLAFPTGTLGTLVKLDLSGGPPQVICETHGLITGASWNRDGTILFGTYGGGIWRVSANGGAPSPMTTLDTSRREAGHSTPIWLPDGKHFLYLRETALADDAGIYIGSIDAGPRQPVSPRLIATNFTAAYAPSADPDIGYILFLRDGVLHAQRLDVRSLTVLGEPAPLANQVGTVFEFGDVAASSTGVLAYRTGTVMLGFFQVAWLDRQGTDLGSGIEPDYYGSQRLSPDGSRVALTRLDLLSGNVDIWLHDFARRTMTRFTSDPAPDTDPVWSPDGKYVAYASARAGGTGLYQKAANGGGDEHELLSPHRVRSLDDWSPDGKFLLFAEVDPQDRSQLWALPLTGDRTPIRVVASEFNITQGQFSPDGRWLAYVSDESGHPQIYVEPFPATPERNGRSTVSTGGGVMPRWRRDGRELLYLTDDLRTVMSTTVRAGTPTFNASAAQPLLKLRAAVGFNIAGVGRGNSTWDVTADGSRFLFNTVGPTPADKQSPLTVVLNWTQLLKP